MGMGRRIDWSVYLPIELYGSLHTTRNGIPKKLKKESAEKLSWYDIKDVER